MASFQTSTGAIEFFEDPVTCVQYTYEFLQMTETIIAYYRNHAEEENAIDDIYQHFQRTLQSITWYTETEPAIHVAIGIIVRLGNFIFLSKKEINLLEEYFQHILFCLKQENSQ
jgi:tRNA C32,U32 (ribose-2'-O)-methylase TrmJ